MNYLSKKLAYSSSYNKHKNWGKCIVRNFDFESKSSADILIKYHYGEKFGNCRGQILYDIIRMLSITKIEQVRWDGKIIHPTLRYHFIELLVVIICDVVGEM